MDALTARAPRGGPKKPLSRAAPRKTIFAAKKTICKTKRTISETEMAFSGAKNPIAEAKMTISPTKTAISGTERITPEPEKSISGSERSISGSERSIYGSERSIYGSERLISRLEMAISAAEISVSGRHCGRPGSRARTHALRRAGCAARPGDQGGLGKPSASTMGRPAQVGILPKRAARGVNAPVVWPVLSGHAWPCHRTPSGRNTGSSSRLHRPAS